MERPGQIDPDVPGSTARPSPRRQVPLGFGGLNVRVGDHITHLYSDVNEMLRILGPYVATGITREERCLVYPHRAGSKLRKWLAAQGIDPIGAERSQQLVIIPGGTTATSHRRIVAKIEAETVASGYPILRIAADNCGVLGDRRQPTEMLKWEAYFDELFARQWSVIALCQFELKKLRGDTVIAAVRQHPLCVVGDRVVRNPFYTPRDQYGLTPRECQVLQMIAWGKSDKEIADGLGIGDRTVETHVAHILEKMFVGTRAAAAAQAVREGIIE